MSVENLDKQIWYKEPIKSSGATCLCCSAITEILPLKTKLYNGFGGWSVTKDGIVFFEEDYNTDWDKVKNLAYIESLIPDNDNSEYVAILFTPLRDAKYQRHARNNWVLIEQGLGFA